MAIAVIGPVLYPIHDPRRRAGLSHARTAELVHLEPGDVGLVSWLPRRQMDKDAGAGCTQMRCNTFPSTWVRGRASATNPTSRSFGCQVA